MTRRALRRKVCTLSFVSIKFQLNLLSINVLLSRQLVNGQCDLIRARVPILRFTDFATYLA